MGPLIGAIDEGTSSARFILFRAGTREIVAFHQKSLSNLYPQEGWVEQDPMEILNTVLECIDKTVEKLNAIGGNVKDIMAVGITNQRESTIVWDKNTGKPLYNSIVWSDVRTTSTVDHLLDQVPNNSRNQNYLKPLCGLPLSPYFSALKLRWLYDNVQNVKKAINEDRCLFGTVDTWLIWNLTGGIKNGLHITDVTNASRTMLMNIETLNWDPVLLNFFELPKNVLPKIYSSAEIYGPIAEGALKYVPIASCLGDQHAALVGQQCLTRGQAKATYGTGCFVLYNTGNLKIESSHGLLSTIGYQLKNSPPVYALEGSVAVAGSAFAWLRDNLQLIGNVKDVQPLAELAKNSPTNDLYFVPAFSGLYAPYWQKDARGVLCGIGEDTTSNEIILATLEAVCFQTRDIIESMNKDCDFNLKELRVDGGVTDNKLLLQLEANLIGIRVLQSPIAETTALGAAMLAGYAVGVWDLNKPVDMDFKIFESKITEDERDMRYSRWKMAIERSLNWDI